MASVEALNPLHRAMNLVLYRCSATAINMASKVGVFLHHCLLSVDLVAAGEIRHEYMPNGGVQWLPVKPRTPSIR